MLLVQNKRTKNAPWLDVNFSQSNEQRKLLFQSSEIHTLFYFGGAQELVK